MKWVRLLCAGKSHTQKRTFGVDRFVLTATVSAKQHLGRHQLDRRQLRRRPDPARFDAKLAKDLVPDNKNAATSQPASPISTAKTDENVR